MTDRDALIKRFMDKVQPEPMSGCWLWVGSLNGDGYGQFSIKGKSISAHRFSYMEFVGPIPDGLHLDHICRVRCCANPAHLEPVTNQENSIRGAKHGTYGKAQRDKTHCANGHPYAGDNLRFRPDTGYRICRTCDNSRKTVDGMKKKMEAAYV